MKNSLMSKDFLLVVLGQIISLFGNATLRFALPLYLLNQTGSSALYGSVTALAMIPAILMSPLGGIIADRVNKRNIMVSLDFLTAVIIFIFSLAVGHFPLTLLMSVTLMLLYGIAGAYQPSVQASIPVLVSKEGFMTANSIINTVNALAGLAGPAVGGILYSTWGLASVLKICMVCFFLSAIMEMFIQIPFTKQVSRGSVWQIIRLDFSESLKFIKNRQPIIGKVIIVACGINLFLSAMIIVGVPYTITEVLHFTSEQANQLCGFAQGAMGAGGLVGGIATGIFNKKLMIERTGWLIMMCAICTFPMGAALLLNIPSLLTYFILTICCFLIMVCSSMFTIQIMTFIQAKTPQALLGKIIAVVLTLSLCAQPMGNILYGLLFEKCSKMEGLVILAAGSISMLLAWWILKIFKSIEKSAASKDCLNSK